MIIISILSILGLICIAYAYSQFKRHRSFFKLLKIAITNRDKMIELMAEDMATDYHSKEWVINYYMEKINEKSY